MKENSCNPTKWSFLHQIQSKYTKFIIIHLAIIVIPEPSEIVFPPYISSSR